MGLPVFRESAAEEPTIKTDPTAQARSTIRRHTRRSVVAQAPSLQRSSTSRLHQSQNANEGPSNDLTNMHPAERILNTGSSHMQSTTTTRPRSRRGPSRDFDSMPPLRRMGNRRIASESNGYGSSRRSAPAVARVNGLGDRERSWSPDGETDTWAVMGSTIEPDANLPSASTSFASGAERLSDSTPFYDPSTGPTARNRRITSFFAPEDDAQDDNEETLRALGELDRQARISRTEARAEARLVRSEANDYRYDSDRGDIVSQHQTDPIEREATPELHEIFPMRAPTPPTDRSLDVDCPNIDPVSNPEEASEVERTLHELSTKFIRDMSEVLSRPEQRRPGITSSVVRRMLRDLLEIAEEHEDVSRRQAVSTA